MNPPDRDQLSERECVALVALFPPRKSSSATRLPLASSSVKFGACLPSAIVAIAPDGRRGPVGARVGGHAAGRPRRLSGGRRGR